MAANGKKKSRSACKLLLTAEVARIFNVHPSTIRRWSDQGYITSYHPGPGPERGFRREEVAILYLDRAIQRFLKGKPV
jgi:DNA-binding transcriptional MerR regulator